MSHPYNRNQYGYDGDDDQGYFQHGYQQSNYQTGHQQPNPFLSHGQQSGTYNYQHARQPSGNSINFQQPAPVYNQAGDNDTYEDLTSYYRDENDTYNDTTYNRPSQIFNTSSTHLNPNRTLDNPFGSSSLKVYTIHRHH